MIINILTAIRDYSYFLSKKQNGAERAKVDYILKMFGFLSFYYASVLILLTYTFVYFNKMPNLTQTSLVIRIVLGVIFVLYPLFVIINFINSKLQVITPLPETITVDEYIKKRNLSFAVLLVGAFLFVASLVLPMYFLGGEIEIGPYKFRRY